MAKKKKDGGDDDKLKLKGSKTTLKPKGKTETVTIRSRKGDAEVKSKTTDGAPPNSTPPVIRKKSGSKSSSSKKSNGTEQIGKNPSTKINQSIQNQPKERSISTARPHGLTMENEYEIGPPTVDRKPPNHKYSKKPTSDTKLGIFKKRKKSSNRSIKCPKR